MTEAKVQVLQTNLFRRAYRRLHNNQRDAVDRAVTSIVEDPALGVEKRGDLAGVFVYKFDCVGRQYLLAYEWDPETRVLLALGVHENFYRDLKRR